MGLAGAIVVASAVFYGLTFLPALLALLGTRVDRLRVPIFQPDQTGRGWWHTIATAVMRRPLLVLVPVVAFILLAGSPFLHLRLATGDVLVLPKHEESRAAYDKLRADFVGADLNHISVVVRYPNGDPPAAEKLVDGFTAIDLDTVNYIISRTPIAIVYIMAATMFVLFLLLGSIVLPLKAVVMNLLSISASFGAMVWIFQDGHLSD